MPAQTVIRAVIFDVGGVLLRVQDRRARRKYT